MSVRIAVIDRLFLRAEQEGRNFLLEPEVYQVLEASGIACPKRFFLPVAGRAGRKELAALGSREVVIKVVSPLVIHKSDVGGVKVVRAETAAVNRAAAAMFKEVPRRYAAWLRGRNEVGTGGKAAAVPSAAKVRGSIRGFLVVEKVTFEDIGFGSEVLMGIRNSRDFGPVLTVGGGGLDVEYMSERLREGRATAAASAHLLDERGAAEMLRPLAFYGKLAMPFRGRPALVKPAVLERALLKFRDLAAAFSPFNDASPFVIEEAEVNPFVAAGGRLVPLDGVTRFSREKRRPAARPQEAIDRLLKPATIGIIGVSEKMNIGRIILRNIIGSGFPKESVFVVKPGLPEIDGCRCFPSVRDLPEAVDMFVLTLAADQCHAVMKELTEHEKARSVIIIAGGMGEKSGGASIEDAIRELLETGRREGRVTPVVNGGNCLGIISRPGRYDTTFIPEAKLPKARSKRRSLAFVSQSGAFMICRLNKLPCVEPLYAISMGNQLDLTAADYMKYLEKEGEAKVVAVYLEGFKPGDGLGFAEAAAAVARQAGREVLVYKSGRSPEGRAATSSHTAAVAGDYSVFRDVLSAAGALVAPDLLEFESFMKGLVLLEGRRVSGRRVGLMSNAGFECVVLADSLKRGEGLEPAGFSPETEARLTAALKPLGIDRLQDIHNPLDVTPVADDAVFAECARAVVEDPAVDCAVIADVPMTPAQQTLATAAGHAEDLRRPGSVANRLVEVFRSTDKPVVVNIDAGRLYDPLADFLEEQGVPVFRHADLAMRFLEAFVNLRLRPKSGR
jgi:acyl-CoA synthetase (NDP forming)